MDKTFDPRHLDIKSFAQSGAQLQGQSSLGQWPRLLDEKMANLQGNEHAVQWWLQGHVVSVAGGASRVGLMLRAAVHLPLQCQRCLGPMVQRIETEREFVFVADEAMAEAMDDEVEEDVLVISRDFDALSLVEDELILALPLVPRHDVCSQNLPTQVVDVGFEAASERPNPFAALASIKKTVN